MDLDEEDDAYVKDWLYNFGSYMVLCDRDHVEDTSSMSAITCRIINQYSNTEVIPFCHLTSLEVSALDSEVEED